MKYPAIPNLPYVERPAGCNDPIWRYEGNPVIKRHPGPGKDRVFNSSVVYYQGRFVGVFRSEGGDGIPKLFYGESKDGFHFQFEEKPIQFVDEEGKPVSSCYQYDPRLVEIEGTYYLIWCDDFHGPALAIAYTKDFKTYVKIKHPFLPFNRNGVLFPRKFGDEFLMLSRPSDGGHTKFGDIFLSRSKDLRYWGAHDHVMEPGYEWWNSIKIGAGCAPIETEEGWIMIFHGVAGTCNGFVYSIGAALLDKDDPSKVIARSADYLLTPEKDYETVGFVPNVCFPVSALIDGPTGRIALYYGAADTVTALAFTRIDLLLDFIKAHKR